MTWKPKLPQDTSQDSFSDWMSLDDQLARGFSKKCECGVDVTYKQTEESQYWHSFWCPKYIEKPKKDKKDGK